MFMRSSRKCCQGPAPSSPSKKSGGRSTEAKDPISSEKATEQLPESVTDPDPQKDKLKASTCGMFAKKMARSVTPTRPSRKVESPNKLLKERDASRSVTPSRSAVKKVDAAVKQSSPTRNGAASRSVSPTRLKQDKTVSSKVELPIKRRSQPIFDHYSLITLVLVNPFCLHFNILLFFVVSPFILAAPNLEMAIFW